MAKSFHTTSLSKMIGPAMRAVAASCRTLVLALLCLALISPQLADAAAASDATIFNRSQRVWFDDDGLIIHKDVGCKITKAEADKIKTLKNGHGLPKRCQDGGDTAQREGWYWTGAWFLTQLGLEKQIPKRKLTFKQVLMLMEADKTGVFYRHPKLKPWNNPWGKEFGFSVDQMMPMVVAMGLWSERKPVQRLWDALPEDAVGKHSFNGEWHTLLEAPGRNCDTIRRRACSYSCPALPKGPTCRIPDVTPACTAHLIKPDCEKKLRDPITGAEIRVCDAGCEACKAARDLHNARERAKAKACQVVADKANEARDQKCAAETKAIAEAGAAKCKMDRAAYIPVCEAARAAEWRVCLAGNHFHATPLMPAQVNAFSRALGQDPRIPRLLPQNPVASVGGIQGDEDMRANANIRITEGIIDKDKSSGDDLNMILLILQARVCSPSPLTENAARMLAAARPTTFGSYFDAYYKAYGEDTRDIKARMTKGVVEQKWEIDPGVSALFGSGRWYHRADAGANPRLAEIYRSIIARYIEAPEPVAPYTKCTVPDLAGVQSSIPQPRPGS